MKLDKSLALLVGLLGAAGYTAYAATSTSLNVPISIVHSGVFDNSGNPWPLTSLVSAINYNTGGPGVGYSAVQRTDDGCTVNGTSYRADYVNFKASTWTAQPSVPYVLCGDLAVSPTQQFNYSVSVSGSTGPYYLTLYTINSTAGAVWTILVDGNSVATVTLGSGGDFTTVTASTTSQFTVPLGTHTLSFVATSAASNGYIGDFAGWQGVAVGTGAIACDEGPNLSTVPAPAQAAGFTHCALNGDFTTSSTDSNGINFSNTATYIHQCASNPAALPAYHFWVQYFYNNPAPCSKAHIVSDPLGGGFNVLDMNYLVSDNQLYVNTNIANGCTANYGPQTAACNYQYSDTSLSWPGQLQGNPGYPTEYYIEATFYIDYNSLHPIIPSTGAAASQNTPIGIGNTNADTQPNSGYFESDQFEINTLPANDSRTSYPTGYGGWTSVYNNTDQTSYSGGELVLNYNWANGYNTVGVLFTSDESSSGPNVSSCFYLNGSLIGNACQPGNIAANTRCTDGSFKCYYRNWSGQMWNIIGNAECYNNTPGSLYISLCYQNDQHTYYKSIRVWVCSSYKTTSCPGPVITSDAGSLRHYARSGPRGVVKDAVRWMAMVTKRVAGWAGDDRSAAIRPAHLLHPVRADGDWPQSVANGAGL